MPRRRQREPYRHVSGFERGRMVGLREAGLSYRAIAVRTGHAATTVMRVWKQWTDEGRTQRRAGSGPRNRTTARDDRHLVRMAITDRTASSTVLARHWNTATGRNMSPSTVRRRLLQAGLVARMPLRRLPLSRHHKLLRLQWARDHRHWGAEWRNVVFSDESRFNVSYNDGRIRVRRYRGERNAEGCIVERHSGQTPGVMVWGAISYNTRSPLLRIEGTLNSNRYLTEVVEPVVLPLLQTSPQATFQQDNARPHVARIVQAFFEERQVPLLPWPARSPDMSPIEHVWDMVGRHLVRHGPPVTGVTDLWARLQTAWREIPQDRIQNLFDSMPRRIAALIAAHGGHTTY